MKFVYCKVLLDQIHEDCERLLVVFVDQLGKYLGDSLDLLGRLVER